MELAVVSGANRLNWVVQKGEDYGKKGIIGVSNWGAERKPGTVFYRRELCGAADHRADTYF